MNTFAPRPPSKDLFRALRSQIRRSTTRLLQNLYRSPPYQKQVFLHVHRVLRELTPPQLKNGSKVSRILSQSQIIRPVICDAKENQFNSRNCSYKRMKCWFQFLITPTADTPGTTLLLHFDNQRYLIGNIAEATQRAAVQRKLGLLKVSDIFLTGTIGWGTTGGLLGLIISLADIKSTSLESSKARLVQAENSEQKSWLNIHGGKNLAHLLATARRFIFRKGMPLAVNEFTERNGSDSEVLVPTWSDGNIKVWAMVVEPESSTTTSRKRSHDEFRDGILTEEACRYKCEQEERFSQMRQSVISSMFDSDWRLDNLVKKKLSEIQQPAAIFHRDSNGKIQKYTGPTAIQDPSVSEMEVLVRNPWPGALVGSLPATTPSSSTICYIVKNHPRRGKFDLKKAIECGVKPGPDFRRLTQGEHVTTAAGGIVTPDMVLGKGKDGSGFAIVDLPNRCYVGPLLSREEWSTGDVACGVEVIVWILGPGVVDDSRLQNFMRQRKEIKHIVSSTDCCANYLAFESTAAAAIRLNLVDPDHFPLPDYSNEIKPCGIPGSTPYERAECGLTVQLEPTFEIQNQTIVPLLNTTLVVQEASKDIYDLAKAAREQIQDPVYLKTLRENQADIPGKDAEVTTLGTGSSLPSCHRNVSATLIRIPGYGNYLFDCGEGTLGQLKRVFGAEFPEVLENLKGIWISHLHADHHLGVVAVVKAWDEVTKHKDTAKDSRLFVASDFGMINWLKEYADVERYGHERIEPIVLNCKNGFRFVPSFRQTSEMGFSCIQACTVKHCFGALAVVFTFPNGFKVAFSGDCRPSQDFVRIGQGATLLIHEATFDDERHGDAIAKKHSTTSEALEIGRKMNARRILLTHFSQRYQKIPVASNPEGKGQVAIVAFDYMKIKVEDFAKMEAFKQALTKLYEDKE